MKNTNIALLVAHEDEDDERGAFISTPSGKIYEYWFSSMVTEKLNERFDYGCALFRNYSVERGVEFINSAHGASKFDLALTIHFDSYNKKWRNRTQVFYKKASRLASCIIDNVGKITPIVCRPHRVYDGTEGYDSLLFIRDTHMPAILIECFNGKDAAIEALFSDGLYSDRAQAWMDKFVEGVVNGIKEYYE